MTRIVCTLALGLALWSTGLDNQRAVLAQDAQARGDSVLVAIATTAGMPALESSAWPPGYREIRIRAEQSMVSYESRPMLRLVEGPGEVLGSLWLFRTLSLRPGNPIPRDDERCAALGDQHICVRPWTLSSGDWTIVANRLERLGAWVLSNPCNRAKVVTHADGSASIISGIVGDAGLLSVERRVGSTLSSFSCSGPGYQREGEGLKAQEIYEYLNGLGRAIPPEPIRIAK